MADRPARQSRRRARSRQATSARDNQGKRLIVAQRQSTSLRSDNQKAATTKNPCEARSSTRSSLRYRPPLHTPTAATVLNQIVARQARHAQISTSRGGRKNGRAGVGCCLLCKYSARNWNRVRLLGRTAALHAELVNPVSGKLQLYTNPPWVLANFATVRSGARHIFPSFAVRSKAKGFCTCKAPVGLYMQKLSSRDAVTDA